MAESGSYLVQSPKLSILCLTTCVKARKSCLVMMYHQTNLDCKSVSISEDLVEMIVALTVNIAKQYFWMILWLMMMHHHTKFDRSEILSEQTFKRYCLGKHSLKFRTFTVTMTLNTTKQPFHKTLQNMNMHCQTKLVAQKNQQFRTYNRNSHVWVYEPKLVTVTLTLKIETHFQHMTLWLIMMSHHTGFGYKWFSDAYHPN